MVAKNTDNHETAFTISIDHIETTTGISAVERGITARKCVETNAKPEDFRRPGHMFPLQAKDNGVFERDGHTEATVDLMKLAGLKEAGLCCEIMVDDGEMMRTPDLIHGEHQVPLFSSLDIDIPIPVREEILTGLSGSSMPVIKGKAGTVFGPAYHIVSMMEKIEKGRKIICSLPANGAYGIEDCSIGLPAVVTRSGAKIDESLKLNPWEQEKLHDAANFLKGLCRRI